MHIEYSIIIVVFVIKENTWCVSAINVVLTSIGIACVYPFH